MAIEEHAAMSELRALVFSAASDLIERAPFLPVVIWSGEHGTYWRDARSGYTGNRDEAGRYTIAQAYRETMHCGPEKQIRFYLVDYVSLDLPMPPSTNALFVEAAGRVKGSGRQRVKTAAYRQWIHDATTIAKEALREGSDVRADPADPIFAENFGLWIRANVNHGSDITNRVKAIEDLLVSMGVTIDDCWNDRLLLERDRSIPAATARILIYRIVQ